MNSLPNFLGLDPAETHGDQARFRVLPVPYEASVSYKGGTANGPAALLTASTQVEQYDRGFGAEPCLGYGVATLPPFDHAGHGPAFIEALAAYTASLHDPEHVLVGLGGEHTISVGLVRGMAAARGAPVTFVQIDAHADLRDTYQDDPYSHACVARRLLEEGADRVVQVGIRSLCAEEAEQIEKDERIQVFWAEDVCAGDASWLKPLEESLVDSEVYLSIDVDGLDPSVIPATGTPEPGGLSWERALEVVGTVARSAVVVGLDVVELAPRPGLHAAEFAAAKLCYWAMNRIAAGQGWITPTPSDAFAKGNKIREKKPGPKKK